MLVGNIDQLMMSHYSPQAVAAVANANQILNIFIMLIVVMSTATTILIAQYLGARNQSKLSEVCTVSLVLNFVYDHCSGRITNTGYVLCIGCRI